MSPRDVQILRALASGPLDYWSVLEGVDGTVRESFAALSGLLERGEIAFERGRFRLSGASPLPEIDLDAVRERYEAVLDDAPEPVVEYFQARMTPDSLFRRLAFVRDRGELSGRDVLLLGDDDSMSIALALTGACRRITVLEIDARICEFLQSAFGELGLEAEVVRYNVCDPLPESLRSSFDVLLCDPVETVPGFRTFLSRGAEALRHPSSVYLGLTEIESSDVKWAEFHRAFLEAGFAVKDIVRDHTLYEESASSAHDYGGFRILREAPFDLEAPTRPWYRSSFCHARSYRPPTPPIAGPVDFDSSFYEDDDVVTN